MKVQTVRWFLLGYLILFLAAIVVTSASGSVGIGASLNAANEGYSFAGGAPPWTIVFALVGVCLFLILYRCETPTSSAPMPHLFRRFVAGLVDWAFALVILATAVGLFNVLVEYTQTGIFHWVIDRHQPNSWDALRAVGGLLIVFALMPVYIAIPMSTGRPTPGACIFGYCVKSDAESPMKFLHAIMRTCSDHLHF